MYKAEISTTIAGIPCLIGVSLYNNFKGSYDRRAHSDLDYYGYTESEWDVLDRRGRKADWLQRKLTKNDVYRIEEEIAQYFKDEEC